MVVSNIRKMTALSVSIILLVVFASMLFGCNTKKATTPISKQTALNLLNSSVKKDGNSEFVDYTTKTNQFKWDDGSYYTFYLRNKATSATSAPRATNTTRATSATSAMNDLSKVFIVHKITKNIYQLDLSKNIQGHVIKKYTKPIASKPKSSKLALSI
jgi:hypothetical protein